MEGKERVVRAIEFRGPDRVPQMALDFFALLHLPPQTWQAPEPYYPYVHPLVIKAGLWKPERELPADWMQKKHEAMDEWGCVWEVSPIASLGEVRRGALQDGWEKLDQLPIPDYSDWNRFRLFAQLAPALGQGKYWLGVHDNSIWERYRFLRGFENALADLIEHPAEARKLLQRLTEAALIVISQFQKAGAHGFMLLDDWGTQLNSFISPRHFAEFFQPCYCRLAEYCHQLGMHYGIHSCGNLQSLLPNFLAGGFDLLQLDSPLMTGLDFLAEQAGGKIAFFNSPDIQTVYPRGEAAELTAHIKEMIRKLGGFNGGLVAWPYIEPNVIGVSQATVKLQAEIFDRWGRYPLDWASPSV